MMRKWLALSILLAVTPAHATIVAAAAGTTYSSNGNVSSFTLNRPSSVNVGDLLLVQIAASANISTPTAPNGWTLLADDRSGSGTSIEQFVYYRVATASDTANGSTSWSLSNNVRVVAAMVGFRSDLPDHLAVIDGAASTDTGNSASLSASSVTASAAGRLVRLYSQRSTSALSSNAALTRHAADTADSLVTLLAASRALAGAGSTGGDVVTASTSARYVIHSVLLIETVTKPTTCFSDGFSDPTAFAQNWATTSVGSTPFTPTITGGHLQLTSDNGYISTAATLQRIFPTSNLLYVEFNHYAYPHSSGADGIAVTLSDASITPQPGGFGGSLGYAQRSDGGGINGFAGGWMGIALDEYGNYSNPTEGRNGGPGFRVDSVAIRGSGSGQTGYAYVAGTTTLNPGIDSSSSPGPGYRYQIIVDAVSATQTDVTVNRDTTGTGNSYTNLIPTFNLQSAGGQAALPANLMLSFTGSTGGSTNVHEIGNLSVCATTINNTNLVDHFEFTYATQALTCESAAITIRACANADCSTLMSVPVTVTLNTSGTWVGGNTQTFTGSTTLQLRQNTPATATFSVANSSPGMKAFSTNKCNNVSGNTCSLPFVDAGLSFDVPNLLANKPSGAVRLRAVKNSGDASNSCVALFQNTTQAINFWSTYTTPNTGTRAVELRPGSGSGPFTSIGGNAGSATALNLTFDNNGETTFEARYQDAGLMALNARYNGSGVYTGLTLSGTDNFVAKPAGFCIDTATSATTCNGPIYSNCTPFVAAGMPFQLQVSAAAWESDSDTNFCSGNGNTPNYNQGGIPLTPKVIAPATGSAGALASYSNAVDLRPPPTGPGITITNGIATFNDITESEVGVFTFSATPPANAYFGETVNGGTSRNIGRFVPYRFAVSVSAAIRNGTGGWSCGFTYQDQPFGFDIQSATNTNSAIVSITALNAANQTTNNYDSTDSTGNNFWKLGSGLAHSYSHLAPPTPGGTLNTGGTLSIAPIAATINNNDGEREYQFSGETFSYSRDSTPNAAFVANLQMTIAQTALSDPDTYLDPNNLSNNDQACYRGGCPSGSALCTSACTDYSSAAITNLSGQPVVEIRYGRLRLNSVSGPADMDLAIPAIAEYWSGSQFITNTDDNCTSVSGVGAPLSNYSGNLNAGETTPSGGATLVSGQSSSAILLSAPGTNNYGSVDITPTVSTWLQFDWDNNAATPFTNPTATASFGTYRGSDRVIYWQETQ